MIPRLAPKMDNRLLAILRKAKGGPLNERQACLDSAGIVARLPAVIQSWKTHPGRGRKANEIRVLAELAADTYWKHTGKGPGRAIGYDGRRCGQYPAFVCALADAASISFEDRALHSACREVQRRLNAATKLPRLSNPENIAAVGAERARQRAALLDTYVVGEDELGFAILGGYEPAPDYAAFNAADIFKRFARKGRAQRSSPQPKRQPRSR